MSRLVQARSTYFSNPFRKAQPTDDPPPKPVDNLVKYIPVEVLSPYLVIANFLKADTTKNLGTYEFVTAVALVTVPIYIRFIAIRSKQPWVVHTLMSTLAFIVWAYASGGLAEYHDKIDSKNLWFNPVFAAVALFLFSIASLFITPKDVPPAASPSG